MTTLFPSEVAHTLRDYQLAAVETALRHNPALIVLPTGSGKTHVMAELASRTAAGGGKALIVSHSVDLVQQTSEKLQYYYPHLSTGINCGELGNASLRGCDVLVASIQSLHSRKFHERADVLMIDECHLVPPHEKSMYRSLFKRMGRDSFHLVGLTATPYRMDCGAIHGDDGALFDRITYSADLSELTERGFLTRIREVLTEDDIDSETIRRTGGEIDETEAQHRIEPRLAHYAAEIRRQLLDRGRESVLVFMPTVRVAETLARILGRDAACVTHESTLRERSQAIERFTDGELSVLCTVTALAIGFDAPNVNAIVMLRPTASRGLYYQMLGRGLRLHPLKRDCLLLDYAGNFRRHGSIYEMSNDLEFSQADVEEREESPLSSKPTATGERDATILKLSGELQNIAIETEITVRRLKHGIVMTRSGKRAVLLSLESDYRVSIPIWLCLEHSHGARYHALRKLAAITGERCRATNCDEADYFLHCISRRFQPRTMKLVRDENGYWDILQ